MPKFSKLTRLPISISSANKYDLLVVIVLFWAGACFLWDSAYWAGIVNMGSSQYGDAAFWWNGALHFAEGIIKNNPNLDFRMGYALFAGLFIAVLGGSFFLFHKLLIVVFLSAASFFYFALKPTLGRISAAGGVALLIFNPFTAEWLAISTSDSVGLILNITALSCFIFGLRNSLHFGFLVAFGLLLASASLTRPLMNPFIAPSIIILVLHGTVTWKRRFQGMGVVLTAFAVPTLLWVIALHGITGSWAMAGHDSTTFYAASDPQIQVWNGAMYSKVEESAKNRYKTQKVTQEQLSKEFWLLTKDNYLSHLDYHFSRIIPHTLDIAGFSSQKTSKSDELWKFIRVSLVAAITVGLAIASILQKRWLGACLVALTGYFMATLPVSQTILTLGGALLFTFSVLRPKMDHTYAVFVLYWWIGVVVLYLVGGTWGPPLGAAHDMNALGYRLGSQFFFVNDLIAVSMLGLISRLPSIQLSAFSLSENKIDLQKSYSLKSAPKFDAAILLSLATYIFISVLVVISIAGAGVVSYRAWQRNHEAPQPFPRESQLQAWWQENQTNLHIATSLEAVSNMSSLASKVGDTGSGGIASHYILFTGGMSDFIWNLDGQARSQAIVYMQNNFTPFTMYPNIVNVEFPLHLHESEWVRKQGAWVVRRLADLPSKSNLPFYFSEISVKAFVPLSKDKKQFDFSAAQIFPLQKYASQLYASGDIKVAHGVVEWDFASGTEKYSRRFSLKRDPATNSSEPVVLELDVSKTVGVRSLSFRWSLERAPNSMQPIPASTTLKVLGASDASESYDKSLIYYTGEAAVAHQEIQAAKIDLTQSKHNKVKLVLNGVMPDDKVWFYEFNMQSDEFLN